MNDSTYKNKWWVLISAGLMILLINIDSTIVNVALAKISTALDATLNLIQWVVSSYLLATAMFFTVSGRLADIHGNKKVFIIGTIIFTAASLLCGLSNSAAMLIASRFIQGIGFASTLGLAIIITSTAFPPEQRGLATGMSVTLTGLGQIIGPTLGGIILSFASWHWIFLINVPIGIACLIMTIIFTPKDTQAHDKQSLDYLAVSLFVLGIAVVATTLNQTAMLQPGTIILFIALGVAMLVAYGFRSRKLAHPMIATSLLTHAEYMKVAFTRLIFMYVWASIMLFLPLYLQNVVGYSPLKTGLLILIMTALIAVASPITGRLIDRYSFKPLTAISMLLSAIACLMFSTYSNPPSMLWLVVSFILFGISVGIHIPSTLNGVMRSSEAQHRSTGMGLFFTIAFIGSIMGIAISGSYMTTKSHAITLKTLVQQHVFIHASTLKKLQSVASGAHHPDWLGPLPQATLTKLTTIAQSSFMHSFSALMWINTVLCIIAMLLALRIKTSNLIT